MTPGDVRESFLVDLFGVVEAIVDEKIAEDHGRDSLSETRQASELKRDLISVWSFGEMPEEPK
jgi:hypothetical protein